MVRKAGVLPPVTGAPLPEVGILEFLLRIGNRKQAAIELDRILPAPDTGRHIALQGIGPGHDCCGIVL